MAAAVLAVVASAAGGLIIKAARMYTVKYGPQRAAQGAELVEDGYHERDFVRLKALREHNGYTEEEYLEALGETERQQAGEDVDLIEFSYDDNDEEEAKDFIQSAATALGRLPTAAPKSIRVFCMTIRMSRELKGTEVFTGPIPLFAHWNIEVDGVFYELREARNGQQVQGRSDGRKVLYSEIGKVNKNIKLEITTNRVLHESTKYIDVGKTMLERDQIIRIAALVFHRFGQGYDIWVDNCQLFAQLLAEAIGGKENAAAIRHILNAKSLLKLPIAASWVAAPAYHIIAVLHHLLPKHSSPGSRPAFLRQADEILEKFENFFYHPRVYVGRRGV